MLQVCVQFSCSTILYYLAAQQEVTSLPARNTFKVLMASQLEKHLPCQITGEKHHGNQRLYNDILDILASMNIGGWTRDILSMVGQTNQIS